MAYDIIVLNIRDEAPRRIADCANDTALVCYCKPKSCHGDIIVSAVQWMREGRQ